ncbi:hypothetical protein N7474_003294 [Penicillium riverlandense]|uniref:uncharacterized protein n=1 Tax=Penicillium riverlandense TaxID=1903569 RepID=UPI0025472B65|nr:uncharacterized protein N7474_003294 [Penicillium riverlandense]KAJ5826156.1 hypothetical protein N7474_003294 [Penicillium riverlandense]
MAATPPTETTPGPPPANSSSDPANPQSQDPNMANPRLLVNRACIYERQLPGDAYITAHVQRLQHGFYSSTAVSDKDAEHVDFLAINFVFHSPHTLSHRFKSATIRASIHGGREVSTSAMYPHGYPPGNPRFLMHAPHLIYGTVSPETLEWTFSLAGSLGISETPFSASVIPSGSMNGQYRRYEMMRIQGSARTLKSRLGPEFDVESGEIVWSLEENNLQRSGLPREFTFVMLIQKPTADSRVGLSIDIEPVIQTWFGSYPGWYLSLSAFRPKLRRGVDFRQETGQRFEPVDKTGRFNFAALESSFDDYIAMPGRKYSRQIQIPPDNSLTPINNSLQQNYPQNYPQNYQSQYGMNMNPMQMLLNSSLSAQNSFAETQLRRLHTQTLPFGNMPSTASSNMATNANANTNTAAPATTSTVQTGSAPAPEANTINIRLLLDHATASNIANMRVQSPRPRRVQSPQTSRPTPTTSRATAAAPVGGPGRRPETTLRRTRSREFLNTGFFSGANMNANTSTVASFSMRDAASSLRELKDDDDDDDDKEKDERDLGVQKHGGRPRPRPNGVHRVMTMANQPLTASMLASLAER